MGWVARRFGVDGDCVCAWIWCARLIPKLSLFLFLSNSAGYFVGSAINNSVGGRGGMLLWGVVYGLFLGAGLGALLYQLQAERDQNKHASRNVL